MRKKEVLSTHKTALVQAIIYHRSDPKFSDEQACTNSVDPDETALSGAA